MRASEQRPLFRCLSCGDHEFDDDASIQGLMVCVDGRNLDFVRSLRKTSDNDRPAAGFGPDPRRAINRHMEMPDAGRHIEGLRAEHRDDLQIFGAVLDEHDSAAQRFGQRRIDYDFRRRLRLSGLSDGAAMSALAPLLWDERTHVGHCATDAVDPQRTSRSRFAVLHNIAC